MAERKYNYSIDFIKFIAIFLVVINHCINSMYPIGMGEMGDWGTFSTLFGYTLATIGRAGVPLFIFCSGYLLLHRDYSTSQLRVRFWKHNLLTIVLCWEIWIVIYNLFLLHYDPAEVKGVGDVILQMLFLRHVPMSHSWYMPMIIGIYIFLPFVAMIVQKVSDREMMWIMLFVYAMCCIVPSINQFLLAADPDADIIWNQLVMDFSGTYYGLYLILGHYLYKGLRWKVSIGIKITVFLALLVFSIYAQVGICHDTFYLWCDFFTMPPMCVIFFDLLQQASEGKYNSLVKKTAQYSFGIFLIHNIFLMLCVRYLDLAAVLKKPLAVLIYFVIVMTASWISVALINRIPHAGNLLFRLPDTGRTKKTA